MSQSGSLINFDYLGRYILDDFDHCRPFSSFLPGIAGVHGIPMWVFYVNRGQGICSFGIEDKDHPILEFQSANKAYQTTSSTGFRTFLNGYSAGEQWKCEAFSPWSAPYVQRKMFIGMNEFEIQEINQSLKYQINVLYFLLPNLPFSGLVRKVKITNLGEKPLKLEVLDGLPEIVPHGTNNDFLKNMGRTIEAWMCVDNLDENLPFFRLKATPGDTTAVQTIQGGNYALSFSGSYRHQAVVDPKVVFGMDTGKSEAHLFHKRGLLGVSGAEQITEGHAMCAFFGGNLQIEPEETRQLTGLFGYSRSLVNIQGFCQNTLSDDYIERKLHETRKLTGDLTDNVRTISGFPNFDGYCQQTYLDNLMRGGQPLLLGDKHIYHVYSRKHGDIERDYNFFVLPAEYYSQGNGNYRDINQNRRNDVFFVPKAGAFNIWLFMSLIQADGYNPLVINGVSFSLPPDQVSVLLAYAGEPDLLHELLNRQFSPGELFDIALRADLSIPVENFFHQVISRTKVNIEAEHGEGYWIDHWTYNLDLIDAYLAIFPEKQEELLFHSEPLPFYDNAHIVQPRNARYVLTQGRPHQMNAVVRDPEKAALIDSRDTAPHWARKDHGRGEVFFLPLISKLALLAIIKFATRDPAGMGIQMEAGKPGWYDALNGLPGLFGSSMPETYELMRLVNFLKSVYEDFPHDLVLPLEAQILMNAVDAQSEDRSGSFDHWDHLTTALEHYRESVRLGFDGQTISVDPNRLLSAMAQQLQEGISRAQGYGEKLPPTYFKYEVTDYTLMDVKDSEGNPLIMVQGFNPIPLPSFLEGPVRLMKISGREKSQEIAAAVMKSKLFDEKLQLFKVNTPLKDQPHEIGRARAFTPGWLENESIWMHMSFKYLLEMLNSGLFGDFFKAFQNHLPAFMDPEVYGRNPLENSSFIVSSAHPDEFLHGNGFVARLSGSTAEFLHIWRLMTVGKNPFQIVQGELVLQFDPALPGWLFTETGTFTFRFLNSCDVIYSNPSRKNTYETEVEIGEIRLHGKDGIITIDGPVIPSPYAGQIRAGQISKIECFYS